MTEMKQPASMVGAARDRKHDPDEVDRLIERRAAHGDAAANENEARWKASERAYYDEREEARRHQWVAYYRTLSRNLRTRAADFEEKANRLQEVEA